MKYATYQYISGLNPKLVATCLMGYLDAQKHLLLNTVYKKYDSKTEVVAETKAASGFIRNNNDNPHLSQMLDLLETCKDERFFTFKKSFSGKNPAAKIQGWITEILDTFPSKKMCLSLIQYSPDLYTLDDGKALRSMLPFSKKCSPMSLLTLENNKTSVYAYLVLMEVDTP